MFRSYVAGDVLTLRDDLEVRAVSALFAMTIMSLVAQLVSSAPPEEHFLVRVEPSQLRVFLRHLPASQRGPASTRPPVLIVHGSTLPSALSSAARIDGLSWMDDLARRGFDVWALDFIGFGGADRYPEMSRDARGSAPLGRATEGARQIAVAVNFIMQRRRVPRVQLVAHSWGTLPAGLFVTQAPNVVDRLVQFGPVVDRAQPKDTTTLPAWSVITPEVRLAGLKGLVPKAEPEVIERDYAAKFAAAYLASDPTSRSRSPMSIALPSGPDVDLLEAWSGSLAYDPAKILVPVLIIRGEWDEITTDADARRLFDELTHAPGKRDVKIGCGTHVMQLETARHEFYSEVAAFLSENMRMLPAPSASTGH